MTTAVYAGTFDPLTFGHLDIIERSFAFCGYLVIAIGINPAKKVMFSVEERVKLIEESLFLLKDKIPINKIAVTSFNGLLTDFAQKQNANILIRGIRSVSDFEYEINLAGINKTLLPKLETVFLPTSPTLAVVSSSMVKEISKHGGDINQFATKPVVKAVADKFGFIKFGDNDVCPKCSKTGTMKWTDDKPSFLYCRECGWHGQK